MRGVTAILLLFLVTSPASAQVDGGAEPGIECPDCGVISFVPAPGGDVRPLVDGQSGGGIQVCGLDPAACDGASGAVGVIEIAPPAGATGGGSATGGDGGGGGSAAPPPTCTPIASAPTAADIGNAPLPAADLGHDPYVRGLTGLDTGVWYQGSTNPVGWVQPGTLGVRTECSTYRSVFGGYAAAPFEYRWHFDEDDTIRSSGTNPGTPQAWAAQHEYDTKGDYTLAVQVRWGVAASPAGGSGTRSTWAYADHPVIEIRSALLAD